MMPKSNMTYQEKLELAISDARGKFEVTDELSAVTGAQSYAKERIYFWKVWNNAYRQKHSEVNTQDRYIAAQEASKVYARAVQKSLVILISNEILQRGISDTAQCVRELKELLWLFSGGSLLIMQEPGLTMKLIAERIKGFNYNLGFQIAMRFEKVPNEALREWILR